MKSIIVTITNTARSFFYDIEIPTDISFGELQNKIIETLNTYNSDLHLNNTMSDLFCNRTNHRLEADETPYSAGIWNGDFITILERYTYG